MGNEFTADGVAYYGIELVWGDWWICFRADDPEKILRFVQVPE
jgi:hypothetical protein